MTALGIEMTDREGMRDWTGLTSGHPVSGEIMEAVEEEKRAWDFFTRNVDAWIECGDYIELAAQQERAERATNKVMLLKKQVHCPHKHVDWIGGVHFDRDGAWDDIRPICRDCGKEMELESLNDNSIADSGDEIPL